MKQNTYWRTNQQIHAPKVRVIGANGKQIGILDIRKALEEANKKELDLVEIAPKANPPVVKIVNFGKFKYQEDKKLRKQKKGIKSVDIKEIRGSGAIGSNSSDSCSKMNNDVRPGIFVNSLTGFVIDKVILLRYASGRPGGSGAAETCEPCQVREEAAVSGSLWVPPGCLPGYFVIAQPAALSHPRRRVSSRRGLDSRFRGNDG